MREHPDQLIVDTKYLADMIRIANFSAGRCCSRSRRGQKIPATDAPSESQGDEITTPKPTSFVRVQEIKSAKEALAVDS